MCNCEQKMNEPPGRVSEHEPTPPVIDRVFCAWTNKRISVHEAQAIYTPHNIECANCQECQP